MGLQVIERLQDYRATADELPESHLKNKLLEVVGNLINRYDREQSPTTVTMHPDLSEQISSSPSTDDEDEFALRYDEFSGDIDLGLYGVLNIDSADDDSTASKKLSETDKAMLLCLKYLFRLASTPSYLDDIKNDEVQILLNYLLHQEYAEMIGEFENMFSAQDAKRAKQYFNEHPDAVYVGSSAGILFSYVKFDDDNIVCRKYELGRGRFGRAKTSTEVNSVTGGAIKSQEVSSVIKKRFSDMQKAAYGILRAEFDKMKLMLEPSITSCSDNDALNFIKIRDKFLNKKFASILEEHLMLPRLKMEASINQDLNIATSKLAIRRNSDGTVYKVYQNMRNLGDPIRSKLAEKPPLEQRLTYAIDLLLHVDDLHEGRLSITNTKYVHGDIKPANILIDSESQLRLVDYGFGRSEGLSAVNHSYLGTIPYLAIDYEDLKKPFDRRLVKETPDYYFNDKISSLRTIFHAQGGFGILTSEQFANLPEAIANLLDTSSIESCIQNNDLHTLRAISAALILYKQSPKSCIERNIHSLLQNPHIQDRIIAAYKQNRPSNLELNTSNHSQIESFSKMKHESEDDLSVDESRSFKSQ